MSLTIKGQITALGQITTGNIPPTTTNAVWSSTKKASDWSLSNGDLSVANAGNGAPAFGGVATEGGITSGKHYWEITITSIGTAGSKGDILAGVAKTSTYPTANVDWFNGSNGTDKIICEFGGLSVNQSMRTNDNGIVTGFTQQSVAFGAAPNPGVIIGVAFDADTRICNIALNGTWQRGTSQVDVENGVTTNSTGKGNGTAGSYHAIIGSHDNNTFGSCAFTANFGQNAFTYTVPSGYNAGLLVTI